jgi:hypothetical protein
MTTRVMNERIADEVAIGNVPYAHMDGLPIKGTKVTRANAHNFIGSIIIYKVFDQFVYSKVESVTNTMLNVVDLDFIITPHGILLYENNTPNPTTNNSLGLGRSIHIVNNAIPIL